MAGNKGWVVAVALAGGIISAAPALAQSILPIARACNDEIDAQLHCASCTSAWPAVVDCIAQRAFGGRLDPAKLHACEQAIWDRRLTARTPAAIGDPISESLRCAGAAL